MVYKKTIQASLLLLLFFATQSFAHLLLPEEIKQMVAEGIEIPREEVVEFRKIVQMMYDSICSESQVDGCEQFEEFINGVDSFIMNGSISTFKLMNPVANALMLFASHIKSQINRDDLRDIEFRIKNFDDPSYSSPV